MAESLDYEDAFALDPQFYDGVSHATREWQEARVFQSQQEAESWCEDNPSPPFHAVALVFDVKYFH